jgi:hypothetical protein
LGSLKFFAIIMGVAAAVTLFARLVMLRLAHRLQRAFGLSDEAVTELSVALPLVLFVLTLMIWVAWLWG